MTKTNIKTKEFCLFLQFEKFIQASKKGRRLQSNGQRISVGTIKNYEGTLKLLRLFADEMKFHLRIMQNSPGNKRRYEVEKKYWKKFYQKFTDFLYFKKHFYDNYIGLNIKNIKTFFNYLNRETEVQAGEFYKEFYVRKEHIAIFPLQPEELRFFINNTEFQAILSKRMCEVKDMFVFGCTVALRFSDLIGLKQINIRIANGYYYLVVKSVKTNTDTAIKLPEYCIDIINKYRTTKLKDWLLPRFNIVNLNLYIKKLLELGGLVQEVAVTRERRGKAFEVFNELNTGKRFRFCDVACTHTMRRTAITTMLCLGMPEQLVRKISGHAPGSKDFFRYVEWAQVYMDKEADKVWTLLLKEDSIFDKPVR